MDPEWEVSNLGNVLESLESGSRPKGGVSNIENGIPSVGGEHLNYSGKFNFEKVKFIPNKFYESMNKGKIQYKDVLIVKDGATTGKTSFVGEDFPYNESAVNEHVFIARTNQKLLDKYLFYYLFSEEGQRQLKKNISGSAQGGINRSILDKIKIKYPESIDYQKEIVAEIEKQLTRLDSATQQLKNSKRKLVVYKNAILKDAFSLGKLKKFNFEIKKIKDVSELVQYGTSDKASEEGKIPVLRMGNLQDGKVVFNKLKFYKSLKGLEDFILGKGDILFNRTNSAELVGKTSLYEGNPEFKDVVFASYLIRIKTDKNLILPKYLNYWMISPQAMFVKEKLKNQQVGQANINGTKLKNIEFPYINDLKIQQNIIDNIENQFLIIDKLYLDFSKSILKEETLRKSILKYAFEGKLVKEVLA